VFGGLFSTFPLQDAVLPTIIMRDNPIEQIKQYCFDMLRFLRVVILGMNTSTNCSCQKRESSINKWYL